MVFSAIFLIFFSSSRGLGSTPHKDKTIILPTFKPHRLSNNREIEWRSISNLPKAIPIPTVDAGGIREIAISTPTVASNSLG